MSKNWLIRLTEKKNHRIRALQLFFLLVTVWGVFTVPLPWILFGICSYMILETLGGNIGLHRFYGHRSFNTSATWEKTLRFLTHYIGVGSVVSWVGQHRYHHENADKPHDVHSPYFQGLMKIIFGVWQVQIPRHMISDVIKDKRLIWWHHNYWRFHLTIIVLLTSVDLFFHTHFLFSMYALPNLMCLISGYVLATVTHFHGYQTYKVDDHSTNSWIANIYTLGEGWHNNHHAFPRRLRQGEKWWEWDLPAWFITTFMIQKQV